MSAQYILVIAVILALLLVAIMQNYMPMDIDWLNRIRGRSRIQVRPRRLAIIAEVTLVPTSADEGRASPAGFPKPTDFWFGEEREGHKVFGAQPSFLMTKRGSGPATAHQERFVHVMTDHGRI